MQTLAAPTLSRASSNGSSSGVVAELDEKQEAEQQAVAADPVLAYNLEKNDWTASSLSVVVLGASGDLAKKKIFPALFSLYYEGLLPEVSYGALLCVVVVSRPAARREQALPCRGALRCLASTIEF